MNQSRKFVVAVTTLLLGSASSIAQEAPAKRAAEAETRQIFAFHNQIGLNLHHFLYWQALPHSRRSGEVADWPETLGAEERATIDKALDYYRKTFEGQDLLFGDELYQIKTALAAHDGSASFVDLGLEDEHAGVLDGVLPIYRRHLWPAHEASNRVWIEHASGAVDRHGEAVMARLVGIYADPFPPLPVRVDVVIEGHWAGAYTTTDPVHVVVAGSRPAYQGKGALEMVFHEATHGMLSPRRGTVIAKLSQAFRQRGQRSPKNLWHALLFYTVGRAVQDRYRREGLGSYRPYAYANGIYDGRMGAFLPTLEREWQIYLEGRVTMDQAVTAMVARLAGDAGDS